MRCLNDFKRARHFISHDCWKEDTTDTETQRWVDSIDYRLEVLGRNFCEVEAAIKKTKASLRVKIKANTAWLAANAETFHEAYDRLLKVEGVRRHLEKTDGGRAVT